MTHLPIPLRVSMPFQDITASIWKMRVRNRDQQRGKSGGFRVIFYFDAGKNPDEKHLLTIYPKAERADLTVDQLLQIYNRFMASIKVRDP